MVNYSHIFVKHILRMQLAKPFLLYGIVFVAIFICSYLFINSERGHDSQPASFLYFNKTNLVTKLYILHFYK